MKMLAGGTELVVAIEARREASKLCTTTSSYIFIVTLSANGLIGRGDFRLPVDVC